MNFSQTKMQNLSLVESLTNPDVSHHMSLKDPADEAGGTSLDESGYNWNERTINEEIIKLEVTQQSLPVVNSKGRSWEAFAESSYSTSEPSNSWGDFEGFRGSLDESERFTHNLEVLLNSTKTSRVNMDLSRGHCGASAGCFCSEPPLCSGIQEPSSSVSEGRETAAELPETSLGAEHTCSVSFTTVYFILLFETMTSSGWSSVFCSRKKKVQANHSYEDIFKLVFPEVFVSQSRESIRRLDQVLDTHNEDAGVPEHMKNQLCIDSGNIWRTLRDTDNTPSLRHPWSKSHCLENLFSVLGVDVNQKDFSGSQDKIFEESNVKDNEDFRFDGFGVNDCKTLIQTKLSVSPDSRHGHLFTRNFFLKTTSSNGNLQYITAQKKKPIFATHNLKMKFFSSDVC